MTNLEIHAFTLKLDPDINKLVLIYTNPDGSDSKVCDVVGLAENFRFKIELQELLLAPDGPEFQQVAKDINLFFFYERSFGFVEELSLRMYQSLMGGTVSEIRLEFKNQKEQ